MKNFFLSLAILVVLTGCDDEPNSIGKGVLPPQDGLKIDSVETFATSASSYLSRIGSTSSTLLLGNADGMQARLLLQYIGIPTTETTAIIDSAVLKLRLNYRFKDSSGTLGLTIHKLLRSWSQDSLSWDSLSNGLYSSTADTTFLKFVASADSTLSIRIDPIARQWFKEGSSAPNGILLIAPSTSTVVVGVSLLLDYAQSIDYRPELSITYHDSTDTSKTVKPLLYQRLSLSDGTIPSSTGLTFLQAGVAYRDRIFFDVSKIPATASVTSAQLQVSIDTTASLRNAYTKNLLILHYALDNASRPTLSGLTSLSSILDSNATKFSFDARFMVQQWASGQRQNYGFILRPYNEFISFDRFAIHTGGTTPALRPKLKIIYTVFP